MTATERREVHHDARVSDQTLVSTKRLTVPQPSRAGAFLLVVVACVPFELPGELKDACMGGTLKGGQKASVWVRATATFRRIDGKWFDVHDHISVPVDFEKGTAALDLAP